MHFLIGADKSDSTFIAFSYTVSCERSSFAVGKFRHTLHVCEVAKSSACRTFSRGSNSLSSKKRERLERNSCRFVLEERHHKSLQHKVNLVPKLPVERDENDVARDFDEHRENRCSETAGAPEDNAAHEMKNDQANIASSRREDVVEYAHQPFPIMQMRCALKD